MEIRIKSKWQFITKTCLYNSGPLKPHFYIVKLGFTGVYIIFLISGQNIDCGYSLEPVYEKYQIFLSENFQFLEVKLSIYLNRRVFVMFWYFKYNVIVDIWVISSWTCLSENAGIQITLHLWPVTFYLMNVRRQWEGYISINQSEYHICCLGI